VVDRVVLDRLLKVFRDVFEDADLGVTEATTAADVPGWDSFNHVNLVLALEEEFGVRFTTPEIGTMASIAEIERLVVAKLAGDGRR
jgi:acyl carrier protein